MVRRLGRTAAAWGLFGLIGLGAAPAAADPVTHAFDCQDLQERFELDLPPGAQPWVEGTEGVEFRLYWRPDGNWQQADADITLEFLTPEVLRITLRDTVEYYWASDTYLNTATGDYFRMSQQAERPGWTHRDGRCAVVVRG